ncbi:FAD-dependent monooxygenase [Chitinimonas sp.]|uniref:FAD-dependent monooxygenase n=1 Tax=Chitinimonas sp. TaxID=1934313 RepID=UPI002F93A185
MVNSGIRWSPTRMARIQNILARLRNAAKAPSPYHALRWHTLRRQDLKAGKRILICGAGIAGPTLGFWLHQYGYSVVIAEKAKAIRDGGQNVDIKGPGQDVIRRMGLAEQILAKNTQEQGQKYLDANGRLIAALPIGSIGSLTSDFEILRGDFANILYEATRASCEYRFGCYVSALKQADEHVEVAFNDGSVEQFELVVCADGIASSTRQMVLSEHTHFHDFGAYMAFFKIPRRPEDDGWAWSINGIGGTMITLRPGTTAETTVLVTFPKTAVRVEPSGTAESKAVLREALLGRGTVAERILAGMDQVRDLYFGPMCQVKVSTWSQGRVVLLGDAGYCPTAFTGQGTVLSLVGAYVLAGEIKQHEQVADAFAAYEQRLRPLVEQTQAQMSARLVTLLHVKSRAGIALMRVLQRLIASSPVQRLGKWLAGRAKQTATPFQLPDYP